MFLSLFFICVSVHAQTADEWLRQKKTKLKYIEQQIVAFQVYADYIEKGYKIASEGWSMVNNIKHGDFDLHNSYLNSLSQVNPSINQYAKTGDIIMLQQQILSVDKSITKFSSHNMGLQESDKNYINNVLSNLLNKCAENLKQVDKLTTNDNYAMRDDERLNRIDEVYVDMQDKYMCIKSFENAVRSLALARATSSNDLITSKLLYGLK